MTQEKDCRNYTFKIELQGIEPPIWRRIRLPGDFHFGYFHEAILRTMGWNGSHLHKFEMTDPGTEIEIILHPSRSDVNWNFGPGARVEEEHEISEYFTEDNRECEYEYDFGDSWKHLITCEKIEYPDSDDPKPKLIDGERNCPPEDVGGVPGYVGFLEALKDPDHEDHDFVKRWIGGDFDPEEFDREEHALNPDENS